MSYVPQAESTADMDEEDSVVDVSVAQFKLVFECATALRTLADVMSNMLETVKIDVWRTESFSGIKIEAIDPKQISLVVSDLSAEVTMDCEHTAFALNTKLFHTCVRSAQPHYSISIESLRDSSSIQMVAYEALSNTSITKYTIPTLVCESERVRFRDIEYTTYIDMDTAELKNIVGMCIKLQGEALTFRVRRPKKTVAALGVGEATTTGETGEEAPAKRPRTEAGHMVLTVSSSGACTHEHTFYSYVKEVGDACVAGKCDAIAHVPSDNELETTYSESFGARHLADFLRSIDRNTVTLKLKESKPLIIHHKFGGEKSFVCLVVAPQIADVDD